MDAKNYSETTRFRCLNEHFPRQSDALFLLMCGVETCAPDKEKQYRPRDNWHLHVILSGTGVMEVDGTRTPLRENHMFILKPGERITYYQQPEDPWTYCWMTFSGSRAEEFVRAAGFGPGVYTRETRLDARRFYNLCDRLMETPQLTAGAAMQRHGRLMEFIGLAIESAEQDVSPIPGRGHKPLYHRADYVRHGLDYMKHNYSSINISDISKYLGIDRCYFSAIFRQSQGITPSEYLLRLRMRQSVHMLDTLTIPIQEIANQVGYEDSLTFSKAFKRFFGVSPKRYREMTPDERMQLKPIIENQKAGSRQE